MGQHARAAVRRIVRLDPACEGGVQARAAGLWQAGVGDLAGERVLEDELGLRGADEAALHERAHRGARSGQCGQASRSERASDHRGGLQRLLRLGRQQVDAGGEDAADGVGDAEIDRRIAKRPAVAAALEEPSVEEIREHLLGEERVPVRVAGDQLQRVRVERARERGLGELGHLLVGEALQRQRLRRRERGPVGAHRPEQEHRARRVGQHALEHLDQGPGAPVQILDDHHRRAPLAELRDQLDPSVLELEKRGPRVEVAGDVEAERQAEDLAAGEPLQGVFGRVLLPQAELRPQHVGERAVGHAPAVGKAAAEPDRRPVRQTLLELADEARLPHARLTNDLHEARAPARVRSRDRSVEPLELPRATHEARFEPVPAARPPRREHPPELPAVDAALLPLRLDRPRLAELERAADERCRALPNEHVAGLRRLLEACGHVDRVAGRE